MRPSFSHFIHPAARNPRLVQGLGRSLRRQDLETTLYELLGETHCTGFIPVAYADKAYALARQRHPRGGLSLGVSLPERPPRAHDLPSRFHFRPQDGVGFREFGEGEDRFLHRIVGRDALDGKSELLELASRHDPCGDLGESQSRGLGHERHGSRSARVDLEHVDDAVLNGELQIHQPDHVQGLRQLARLLAQLGLHFGAEAVGGQRTTRIARVHPGLFDVLHDPADQHILAVADRVHIHFDGNVQKAIEQYRAVVGNFDRVGHVST